MRAPLPSGFMDGGRFSWPQDPITKRQCLGYRGYKCTNIVESATRKPKLRCKECAIERKKELNREWHARNPG